VVKLGRRMKFEGGKNGEEDAFSAPTQEAVEENASSSPFMYIYIHTYIYIYIYICMYIYNIHITNATEKAFPLFLLNAKSMWETKKRKTV